VGKRAFAPTAYDGHNDNDCSCLQHREQSQPSSVQQHICIKICREKKFVSKFLLCTKFAEKKKHFFFAFTFHKYIGVKTGIKNNPGHDKTKYFWPVSQFMNPIPYTRQTSHAFETTFIMG